MKGYIDLHTHTTVSDGIFTPKELIEYADNMNIELIAITDHDTVDGVEEAIKFSKEYNIKVIPGIELSIDFKPEMHIIGYFIKYKSKELIEVLNNIKSSRFSEVAKLFRKLNRIGINFSPDEVKNRFGRVDGYNVVKMMIEKEYIENREEAINKYMNYGKPLYVEKKRLSPKEGIELIKSIGGLAILAHPNNLGMDIIQLENLIRQLIIYGLDGIECYNSRYNMKAQLPLKDIALKYNLLTTGGTDFHGETISEFELKSIFQNLYLNHAYFNEL